MFILVSGTTIRFDSLGLCSMRYVVMYRLLRSFSLQTIGLIIIILDLLNLVVSSLLLFSPMLVAPFVLATSST